MNCWLTCFFLQFGVAGMAHHRADPNGEYWRYDINEVRNPYGTVEAGWVVEKSKVDVSLSVRHASSLAVNDFGTNSVEVSVRWRPFKR